MKYIKSIFLLSFLACQCCTSSDTTTSLREATTSLHVVPLPRVVEHSLEKENQLVLSAASGIHVAQASLTKSIQRWMADIEQVYNVRLQILASKSAAADLLFAIDTTLRNSEHKISITDKVEVRGGSKEAVLNGAASLLQLATTVEGQLAFPRVQIKDSPAASYRGLMIDLARNWHSVETIKQCIDLAYYYKTNYVHLHFTDYQSYTLPSKAFPDLSTPNRHYSFEELTALEAYAQERGVILVPEIDVPGHASSIVEAYPVIFGIQALDKNPYILNMGNEEVYASLETIIGEIAPIFKSSPYFHIGGDEAIFDHVLDDPKVQSYMQSHHLGTDVHDLYRHFIVRVDSLVRRQGKQTCVWEGFRPEGKIDIPKEILVFEFETNRYLPQQLIDDGYTVVNTAWKPLYVVNKKKFSPSSIYEWNQWYWANWWPRAPSFEPIQIAPTDQVIGGQMCSWEQAETVEIPSLRKRLPIMNERLWNEKKRMPLANFLEAVSTTDEKLSLLIKDDRQDRLFIGYDWTAEMDNKN